VSKDAEESKSPIIRDTFREESWTPLDASHCSIEAICSHIETHIGPMNSVVHEVISDLVHRDVHQAAPSPERPYWTLITTGMSDLPTAAPPTVTWDVPASSRHLVQTQWGFDSCLPAKTAKRVRRRPHLVFRRSTGFRLLHAVMRSPIGHGIGTLS